MIYFSVVFFFFNTNSRSLHIVSICSKLRDRMIAKESLSLQFKFNKTGILEVNFGFLVGHL